MGIPILGKVGLYIETGPWFLIGDKLILDPMVTKPQNVMCRFQWHSIPNTDIYSREMDTNIISLKISSVLDALNTYLPNNLCTKSTMIITGLPWRVWNKSDIQHKAWYAGKRLMKARLKLKPSRIMRIWYNVVLLSMINSPIFIDYCGIDEVL